MDQLIEFRVKNEKAMLALSLCEIAVSVNATGAICASLWATEGVSVILTIKGMDFFLIDSGVNI